MFKFKKCGQCNKWMKSNLCPKEKNVNGWNKGPGMDTFICKEFEIKPDDLIKVLTGE